MMNTDTILKRFDTPDEIKTFPKGKFETVTLGGMTIGRATYEPGWKWSEHVGKHAGAEFCTVEHVGMVVSGTATAAMKQDDGSLDVVEMKPGDFFYVPSDPHDSWVVGDEPYVSSFNQFKIEPMQANGDGLNAYRQTICEQPQCYALARQQVLALQQKETEDMPVKDLPVA